MKTGDIVDVVDFNETSAIVLITSIQDDKRYWNMIFDKTILQLLPPNGYLYLEYITAWKVLYNFNDELEELVK